MHVSGKWWVWSLAGVAMLYTIRYLRASNAMVASLYPQPITASQPAA